MSEGQKHETVVAVWAEHSVIGHHYEELLAERKVIRRPGPEQSEGLKPFAACRLRRSPLVEALGEGHPAS